MAIRDLIPFTRESTTPSSWRDWDTPISGFRREMDRLFDDFFRAPALGAIGTSMATNWPSIDVKDQDNEVLVTA